jgi:hypothetical protein
MTRPRDTRTGGVLERMVIPSLQEGGYTVHSRVSVGKRLGGGEHFVDVVAEKAGRRLIISLKWQQVSGTAEQKVPFEVICLEEALTTGAYSRAYLVLGGEGWKLRSFYTGGGLESYLRLTGKVGILTLESFVAKANRGDL